MRTGTIKLIFTGSLICLLAITGLWSCGGQRPLQAVEQAAIKRDLGEAYMHQGDATSALRELSEALKLNPLDPLTHDAMGLCYMARNRMPEAISHFQRALELKPTFTAARNNLGVAYLAVEEWDAAIAIFDEIKQDALYATPQFAFSNLGLAYYHKKDFAIALSYYREALKMQPELVSALVGTGRTHLALNQGRQALPHLERAVKLSPRAAEIHFLLAEAYLLTNQNALARASYETVIDLAPRESTFALMARQRLGLQ